MRQAKIFTLIITIATVTLLSSGWVHASKELTTKNPTPTNNQTASKPKASNTPESFCSSVDEKFENVCGYLKMDNMIENGIIKRKFHSPGNFLKVVLEANDAMVIPDNFKQLTKHAPELLAEKLGFASLQQLSKAICGPALLVRRAGLEALSRFTGAIDQLPDGPLDRGYRMIVPLDDGMTTESESLSSLTFDLREKELKWVWVRRGAPNFIKKIRHNQEMKTVRDYKDSAREIIEIPGFNLRFLGVRNGNQLSLYPLHSTTVGKLILKEGEPQSSSAIFAALAPEARKLIHKNANETFQANKVYNSEKFSSPVR